MKKFKKYSGMEMRRLSKTDNVVVDNKGKCICNFSTKEKAFDFMTENQAEKQTEKTET